MSVIVKGMEMPVMCSYCKFREPFIDSTYCHLAEMDMEYEESDNCRHPNCPLIEIPTPHGRLIDADALRVLFADWYRVLDDNMREEVALRYIDDAPTVIEAERIET